MAILKETDAMHRLASVLESERRALLGGRFDLLQRLMIEKERSILAFRQVADAGMLVKLHDQLERNQKLLHAAAQGIRAAKESVSRVGREKTSLVTYDKSGVRGNVMPGQPSHQSRA